MLLFIFAWLLLRAFVTALQVTPGSTCASICLDNPESDPLQPTSSTTTVGDITCNDGDYESTSKGIKFKNCVECLQQSTAINGTENDISWFLCKTKAPLTVQSMIADSKNKTTSGTR